jgi:hypothetical protein
MPSAAIETCHYEPGERRLDIRFVSGHSYSYYDVPPTVAVGLVNARSKGGYFQRAIRGRFRFARVEHSKIGPGRT